MPRRQITKPKDLDDLKAIADDLPDLTSQQQHFVEGLLEGKTASDAYRGAYDTSDMSDRTLWNESGKLRSHPSIATWLAAARRAELGSAIRTREQHIRRLDSLQQIAIDAGNIGAAVQAEQYIGKVEGLYIDRIVDETQNNPHSTFEVIEKLFGPDIAKHIASQHARVIEHKPAPAEEPVGDQAA